MLDLIEPVRVTKNTSPDLLDGEGSSTNGSTSGRYVDRLPITGYYKRQRLRTTHQLRSNRRLCRPTARIFAHSKSERRVRRWRSAYSSNKGEDYGPSREINNALADEIVGGDDSANADNSALTVTQLDLLQDRAPGDIQIPGNHASALRDCSMISAGP